MKLADFAYPGDLTLPTGGYGYDRAMLAQLPELSPLALDLDTLTPSRAELDHVASQLAGTGPVVIDGLALGVLPASLLKWLNRPVIALCHHPLGLETGLAPELAEQLITSEQAALATCAAVVATSERTGQILRTRFGVEDPAIVEPGLDMRPAARRNGTPPILLTLASYTPRKGHDVLLAALERIADLEWRAVWAGAEPDDAWRAQVEALIAHSPVVGRITRHGPVARAELDQMLAQADLFCLPTHYEGYGMVFAEAMMAGLPIVACAGGAVPDVVPPQAGHVVEPGDAVAVADRLRTLLVNPEDAERMAARGRAHALTLPGWSEQAARFKALIRGVCP